MKTTHLGRSKRITTTDLTIFTSFYFTLHNVKTIWKWYISGDPPEILIHSSRLLISNLFSPVNIHWLNICTLVLFSVSMRDVCNIVYRGTFYILILFLRVLLTTMDEGPSYYLNGRSFFLRTKPWKYSTEGRLTWKAVAPHCLGRSTPLHVIDGWKGEAWLLKIGHQRHHWSCLGEIGDNSKH